MRLAAVTTQSSLYGRMEIAFRTSDVFVVQSNGTLVNLNVTNMAMIVNQIIRGGVLLAPGQSITLTILDR